MEGKWVNSINWKRISLTGGSVPGAFKVGARASQPREVKKEAMEMSHWSFTVTNVESSF